MDNRIRTGQGANDMTKIGNLSRKQWGIRTQRIGRAVEVQDLMDVLAALSGQQVADDPMPELARPSRDDDFH